MSNEKLERDYEDFFTGMREFDKTQDKQKQRGLNNYNLLTAVLKPSDEVRLHSRMIYSLLNPNGKHFQGTLFLEIFLKVLNLKDFDLNLRSCLVYKEYANIDLYITDGTKHIIIENKVYAGDQKDQIKRYLKIIKDENPSAGATDIVVLYLTLDGKELSEPSLGGLNIKADKVMDGGSETALYKSISYKNEMMTWLEDCQHEVQNLSNLNHAVTQYMDVVKMINNEYKGAAMSLADYIEKNKDVYAIALEVSKAIPEVRKSIADTYFDNVVCQLREKLDDSWVVEIKGDLSSSCSFPLRVYKREWGTSNSLILAFEFDKKDYHNCFLGVVRRNGKISIKNDIFGKFKDKIDGLNKDLKTNAWWLHKERLFVRGDFVEYIRTKENSEQNLVDAFIDLIEVFEKNKSGLLSDINSYLKNKNVES